MQRWSNRDMMHTSQLHNFGRRSQTSWQDLSCDIIDFVVSLGFDTYFLAFVVVDESGVEMDSQLVDVGCNVMIPYFSCECGLLDRE
jgi:hypothetical protein